MSVLIDRDSLGQLKDFIGDKFPHIVETYLTNSQMYVDAIQAGMQRHDAQAISDAAHPLKSSSGNMGLKAMYELCQCIEHAANAVIAGEESMDNLAPHVEKIGSLYAESAALLKAEVD